MRKLMLLASAAMLLVGQGAYAQGKGQGHGQGGGGGPGAEHGNRGGGGGGGKGHGGGGPRAEQGNRGGGQAHAGGGHGKGRGNGGGGHESRQAVRDDNRSGGHGRGRNDVVRMSEDRGRGRGPKFENSGRGNGNARSVRVERIDNRDRLVVVDSIDRVRLVPALAPGCPPGLAKKHNGCLPPGQAKKIYGDPYTRLFSYSPWYGAARDYDWRYMDGYAYRLDPLSGLVSSFLPLLGGSLFPGRVWPTGYNDYRVDPYYPRYYGNYYGSDWDDYDYRYVDGAIYTVDPRTQRIDSIAGLMAGDSWAVGRPMPPGYGLYNVPPPYRSQYYDSPTDWYRYSDGYVYRVDPTTQLISAAISLLV